MDTGMKGKRAAMKIAILGTGMVGATIGSKLVQNRHDVRMGSRTADNEKAAAWLAGQTAGKGRASVGTFADAAQHGNVIFNCTAGSASLQALQMAGSDNLRGKVVIDIANPLDYSHGMPPTFTVCNTDSLGEQIQRAFPGAMVVKTLNTMNCKVMVEPSLVPGEHVVFMSGDEPAAKEQVKTFLTHDFGWNPRNVIDLGGIVTARGPEMVLALWVNLRGVLGHNQFNFGILTKE